MCSFGTDLPIDPALWNNFGDGTPVHGDSSDQDIMTPCTCLSIMYLTVTELQTVQSFAFPAIVIPLRKAMGVLSDLIHCPQCPKDNFTAIQNIQSIVSLCKAIVERFNKVLTDIDKEAERLEETGQKKPYRIGDNSPENLHLHTGGIDCPMGFNIDVEPKDWKKLAKTALKTEVYGRGSNQNPLLKLISEAEQRQQRWHENAANQCSDRGSLFGEQLPHNVKKSCEALGSNHIRRMIDNLKWE